MRLKYIKYGRRKIRIEYTLLTDCYGLYDPNTHSLKIDKRQKGTKLFNTIMHELFHIIIAENNINVNDRGEEPIAQAVGDGYEKVFKANPKLRTIINKCFKGCLK